MAASPYRAAALRDTVQSLSSGRPSAGPVGTAPQDEDRNMKPPVCAAASSGCPQLVRHPIGAVRAPAIGAVGGDVVAVLDDAKRDRAFDLARQPFRIPAGH